MVCSEPLSSLRLAELVEDCGAVIDAIAAGRYRYQSLPVSWQSGRGEG
jgi:hypothetical protein